MAKYESEMKGKGSFANMPESVDFKPYKKNSYVTEDNLDDTITGIDETIGKEVNRARKFVSNQK